MKYLNTVILVLAAGLIDAKLVYRGRRALTDESDGGDANADGAYGGKKAGYVADADGAYGGKKAGYIPNADGAYGGKKAGYAPNADGGYGGKKGSPCDGDGYGGKKAGYDADGAYAGKKGGGDADGAYAGKKGGYDADGAYGGKKGGYDCTEPTNSPTNPPTDPEVECVTGRVRFTSETPVIDIEFNYPELEPKPSDWVGLYPCSDADLSPPFSREPTTWAYTCYDRVCRFDDASTATGIGSFTFDDETLPAFGSTGIHKTLEEIVAQQPGCYIVVLNRIDGDSAPPYYNICMGNTIQLVDDTPAVCNNIPPTGCSICGVGKFVSQPDVVFEFPGQPAVPCGILETAGLTGEIPLEQCGFLPALADPFCDCDDCA